MLDLAGYDVLSELHRSDRTLVFRARRLADGMAVVLKTTADEFPEPSAVARLQHEFTVVRTLDSPCIVRAHSIEMVENRPVIVFEDFGGVSLRQAVAAAPVSVAECLDIAVEILTGLAALHRANVIHRDLDPSNVVINRAAGTVKLIDFDMATTVALEQANFADPAGLNGALPYMSPEQTGRMNRRVDYRTDFYSLGVTLYELLTGAVPFASKDPLEIVYGHLALTPVPPGDLNDDIPATISAVVMKLLAKSAEDRYQSAEGILADVTEARRQLRDTGRVNVFLPGIRDVAPTLRVPQRLYGRSAEYGLLRDAFERARAGQAETVFVTGAAGLGKTALAQELYPDVTRRKGMFAAGTFDRFQRNVPYSAVVEAFRSLVRHALTESESRIAARRARCAARLGGNVGLVTAVIPELEIITGPPPLVPELPLLEAGNRFRTVFRQFVQAFATPEQPLVIFLDDCQWADAASFTLVGDLMTDPDLHHFLLVVADRDGEAGSGQLVRPLGEELTASGARFTTLALTPLSRAAIREFVADAFGGVTPSVPELASIIHRKTGGNPFFASEFLKSLVADGALGRIATGEWTVDFDAVRAAAAAENVVEFLADNLRKLQPSVRRTLEMAACVGHRFSVDVLARVAESPEALLRMELAEAVAADLLVGGSGDGTFAFVHDRIRQAAYSLIPEAERPRRHLAAGRALLTDSDGVGFEVADHLNLGATAMTDPAEREALVALNLRVGQAAKASAAFVPALAYFEAGLTALSALSDRPWETHPDLTLRLHVEAVEAANLSTEFDVMEKYVEAATGYLKDGPEAIRLWESVLLADFARYRFNQTVTLGRAILADLGVVFPDQPTAAEIGAAVEEIQEKLAGKSIEDLVHLPEMADPTALAASRILHRVAVAAYFTSPELMVLLTLKRLSLLLDHGNMAYSSGVYAGYSVLLCGQLGRIADGVRFGNLAMKMAERSDARATRARTFFVVAWFARVWERHLRESLDPLFESFRSGLETGEFEFASAGLLARMEMKFAIGTSLREMETEIAEQYEQVARLRQERHALAFAIFRQCVANLVERTDEPWAFTGPWANETTLEADLLRRNDTATLGTLAFLRLYLKVLFGRRADAVADADLTLRNFHAIRATCLAPRFALLDSLARLGRLTGDADADAEIFAALDENRAKLEIWARHAPMNYEHLLHLHDAERCRVAGRAAGALDHYDRAVELAHANGFLHDEAFANELAAAFFVASGKPKLARVYAQEARYAYLRWGALAKVRHLDETFSALIGESDTRRSGTFQIPRLADSGENRTVTGFDFSSVMKAAQALSGEIRLDQLLDAIMRIALENAGAQRGLLLLPDRHGAWRIEAENDALVERIRVLQSEPPREGENLPVSVVNFVARTGEAVLLDDAPTSREFGDDPYIRGVAPRSVLCLPVLHQGKLTAMLYLENRLMGNVFTPQRREVLNLLTAQAAVSLENARLYADLEAKVSERTAELEEKTTQLFDSLRYAERIQQAILPSETALRAVLPESFVFFQPKDIVSGDFYWVRDVNGELVVAVGDCTGHGVPGALMAMIGDALLEQIVVEKRVTDPARILARLHVGINRALKREGVKEEVFESMDAALVRIARDRRSVTFAGARRSLYFTGHNGELRELKGDRAAVGSSRRGGDRRFSEHEIEIGARMAFYLVTDGFADQNDPAGVKFGVRRLRETLTACSRLPMSEQRARLEDELSTYRGGEPQRDDITVFGFMVGESGQPGIRGEGFGARVPEAP